MLQHKNMSNKKITVRVGEKVKISGIYKPAGAKTEEVLSKGDRVPPNNVGVQQRYTLVRAAKHKK